MNYLKNLIKILSDIRFENFLALRVLGILLILAYIFDTFLMIGLSISISSSSNIFTSLLFFVIFYPISLVIIRINFEAFSALIKIAENTSQINKKLETFLESIEEKCQNTK